MQGLDCLLSALWRHRMCGGFGCLSNVTSACRQLVVQAGGVGRSAPGLLAAAAALMCVRAQKSVCEGAHTAAALTQTQVLH